ncbi:hypothetical protein V6N11_030957 [Hibiscus sabdariffa]|uniref:Uncharacterized protein n=1 Tax=Hibiscus sabdariffa TaxID=183260 RepID=A0ABR2NRW0_9ROSI
MELESNAFRRESSESSRENKPKERETGNGFSTYGFSRGPLGVLRNQDWAVYRGYEVTQLQDLKEAQLQGIRCEIARALARGLKVSTERRGKLLAQAWI